MSEADDGAVERDRVGRLLDLPAEGVELPEVDLPRGKGIGKRQLKVALQIERIGDVLLVGDRVEPESDDGPFGADELVEDLPCLLGEDLDALGRMLGKVEMLAGGKMVLDPGCLEGWYRLLLEPVVEKGRIKGDCPAVNGDRAGKARPGIAEILAQLGQVVDQLIKQPGQVLGHVSNIELPLQAGGCDRVHELDAGKRLNWRLHAGSLSPGRCTPRQAIV